MTEDSRLYTCDICGEEQLNEIAMRTHMYTAHVYNEVACMFCDLRGVTAEEMTLHINSVHCFDYNFNDDVGCYGSQQHLTGVQHGAEKQRTDKIQVTQMPIKSVCEDREALGDLVDSNSATDRTDPLYSSNKSSNCNTEKGSHQSAGNVCTVNREKQQKRKHSETLVASSTCSGQDKTDLTTIYVSSCSGDDVTTKCRTSLSQCSASASQRLPKTALVNHLDQACQGGGFVEHSCL